MAFGLALLVLAACGQEPTAEESAEFDVYARRFESYARAQGRGAGGRVPIVFGNAGPVAWAVCETGFLRAPRIVVSRERWGARSETTREIILLHELGHCRLGREHRDDTMNVPWGGHSRVVPASLMHSQAVPAAVYLAFKDYYLNELFSQ